MTYDSSCVKCRYSRPGATGDHRDHLEPESSIFSETASTPTGETPALFAGCGTASRVDVLALFDVGAPTPKPRPAPRQSVGQLGLLDDSPLTDSI